MHISMSIVRTADLPTENFAPMPYSGQSLYGYVDQDVNRSMTHEFIRNYYLVQDHHLQELWWKCNKTVEASKLQNKYVAVNQG